jgi:hypothetical protein
MKFSSTIHISTFLVFYLVARALGPTVASRTHDRTQKG